MNILLKITLVLCFISCKVTDKNEIITITGIAENGFMFDWAHVLVTMGYTDVQIG